MRSAPDLITELVEEAKGHWCVAMVIGFDKSPIYVHAKDKNPLATLNSAVDAGGIPVGLIAADKSDSGLFMRVRVFPSTRGQRNLMPRVI